MSPKVLPASVLMPEYEALLLQGAELPLVISGGSMLPFLAPGRSNLGLLHCRQILYHLSQD